MPAEAHPLDSLPRISLNELKGKYSNEDTLKEFLPWFWDTFYNEEEWSVWKFDYKYNDELTLTFMSNNLIGGFFARLEASLKYMFGAAVVYGENNNNGIQGVAVVRGKDFKPAFEVAPDWESFEFTKIDPKSEEDKATVAAIWDMQDAPVVIKGENRTIADGKVLK